MSQTQEQEQQQPAPNGQHKAPDAPTPAPAEKKRRGPLPMSDRIAALHQSASARLARIQKREALLVAELEAVCAAREQAERECQRLSAARAE